MSRPPRRSPARAPGTPDPQPAAYAAAVRHFRDGRYDDAGALLREVVGQRRDFAPAWHLLGLCAARQGRTDEAVRCLDRASRLEPASGEIHAHRAEILRQAGQLDRALEAAEAAVRRAPGLAAAHNNLGLVWLDLEKADKARAALETAIAIDPAYARAHYNLGNALLQLDEPAAAEASLRRAVEILPRHVHAWTALGVALASRPAHCRQSTRSAPNAARASSSGGQSGAPAAGSRAVR